MGINSSLGAGVSTKEQLAALNDTLVTVVTELRSIATNVANIESSGGSGSSSSGGAVHGESPMNFAASSSKYFSIFLTTIANTNSTSNLSKFTTLKVYYQPPGTNSFQCRDLILENPTNVYVQFIIQAGSCVIIEYEATSNITPTVNTSRFSPKESYGAAKSAILKYVELKASDSIYDAADYSTGIQLVG